MPARNKPDMAPYSDQKNPNVEGWPEALKAMGQDPYEGFDLAYGYQSEAPGQLGEKSLPNSAPQTFVTDNYKPSKSAPGRTGSGGE